MPFLTFLLMLIGGSYAGELEVTRLHPSILIVGVETYKNAASVQTFENASADCVSLHQFFWQDLHYNAPTVLALCSEEQTTREAIFESSSEWLRTLRNNAPLMVIWIGYGAFGDVLYSSASVMDVNARGANDIPVEELITHLKKYVPEGVDIYLMLDTNRESGHQVGLQGPTASSFTEYDVRAYSASRGSAVSASTMPASIRQCWGAENMVRADGLLDGAELGFCLKRYSATQGSFPDYHGTWNDQVLVGAPMPLASSRTPLLKTRSVRLLSLGVGTLALAGGASTHFMARQWYNSLEQPRAYYQDEPAYQNGAKTYHRLRYATYGLYGLALVSLGTGAVSIAVTPNSLVVHGQF